LSERALHGAARFVRRLAAKLFAIALLGACIQPAPLPREKDPIEAAFVLLGAGGAPIARAITRAAECPSLVVDGAARPMSVRAAPATLPLRPTMSSAAESKPSVFPVLVCDAPLATGASRASIAGHALPLPRHEVRRIVVIGDTGCRLKISDDVFQACDSPAAWAFPQIAVAAAATQPDLVIHVGDYHYRENGCPSADAGCAGSPWGYGWDAWKADFFGPAQPLLAAAPWVVVRGNHESCNRAGQGWWRLLDPRQLAPRRNCDDPRDDSVGDYSEPYAVPAGADMQLIVFDSSKVKVAALAATDAMYRNYDAQMRQAFALAGGAAHNFFLVHHPVLGFAPNPTLKPTGLDPGNEALQSVLEPIHPRVLFPPSVQMLLSGHVHLFEMVSFATAQPAQLISGNGGTWSDAPLPLERARAAEPAPGARIESIVSTTQHGFLTLEKQEAGAWRIEVRDGRGQSITTCMLRDAKAQCTPEKLP